VRDDVVRAVRVPGVVEVKQVRVRRSGPEAFADVMLTVERDASFERTHDIASAAEAAIQKLLPGADVVVHVEPVKADHEGWLTTVRVLAARHGLGAHGIRIYDLGKGGHSIELHLEVDDGLSLNLAHAQASAFEQALREAIPDITQVITHIEPVGDGIARRQATATDEEQIRRVLETLAEDTGLECHPHDVTLRRAGGELQLTFHCTMAAGTPITDAHTLTERLESLIRSQVPNLGRVVIHVEPNGA
jgi:divalent metal cation (Fe/Co/Zn/Cd) transporter